MDTRDLSKKKKINFQITCNGCRQIYLLFREDYFNTIFQEKTFLVLSNGIIYLS